MAINKAIVSGRITKDVELKYTQNGKEYINFTIAVPDDDKETDFIYCTAWNNTAKIIAQYCFKGTKLILEGKLKQEKYKNKHDEDTSILKILVGRVDIVFDGKTKENDNNEVEKKQTTKNEIIDDDDFPF